ncbi:MAG: aspartyl protease family protein [Pyrinomonadaceae bacterium]
MLPVDARFREVEGRGLLVRTWINDTGPYVFAIDTGAGATIISRRVADESKVALTGARPVRLSGLSGALRGNGARGRASQSRHWREQKHTARQRVCYRNRRFAN